MLKKINLLKTDSSEEPAKDADTKNVEEKPESTVEEKHESKDKSSIESEESKENGDFVSFFMLFFQIQIE